MDHWKTSLATVILGLTISMVTTTSGATDENGAQAHTNGGSSSGVSDQQHVMRRYVPQFIGKRENELTDSEVASSSEQPMDSDIDAIDNDADYLDFLKQYDNYDYEYDPNNQDESDFPSLDEIGDIEQYTDSESDESDASGMTDDKRYVPQFIGKRDSIDEDKRYQPRFIGKRYRPWFVGKRYQPNFIGKRYMPRFVGKRYQPTFIGKRYLPRFVGKRYQPNFIGKRYMPRFVGKRYTPRFIGKRYTPRFIGKRPYQPMFIGKRYTPRFIGKRYLPRFVGKRFDGESGEQEDDQPNMLDLSGERLSLEKRSTESDLNKPTGDLKERHKRSLGFADEYKRSWGRYVPWKEIPTFKVLRSEHKRFVAPEFIGRRDSISSILSALKALKLTRSAPRLETKRFQAPLFVGKRDQDMDSSDDLYWNRYDLGSLNDELLGELPLYRDLH